MLFCKNWKVAHHKQRADYQRPTDRLSLANQTNHLGAAERELKKNISPSSCPFENTLFNSQILKKYNYFLSLLMSDLPEAFRTLYLSVL